MNIIETIELLTKYKRAESFGDDVEHLLKVYQSRIININPYKNNYTISGIRGSGKTMFLKACYHQLLAIMLMECHQQEPLSGIPLFIQFSSQNFSGSNASKEWFEEFKKGIERSIQKTQYYAQKPELYIERPLLYLKESETHNQLSLMAQKYFDENKLIASLNDLRSSANGGTISTTLNRIFGRLTKILKEANGIIDLNERFQELLNLGTPILLIDEISLFNDSFYTENFDSIFNDLSRCHNQKLIYTVLPHHYADKTAKNASFHKELLSFNVADNNRKRQTRRWLEKNKTGNLIYRFC